MSVADPGADVTVTIPASTTTLAGLAVTQSFTKAQRGTPVALTDGATIAVDMSLGNNFSVTLGGNRSLGDPSNVTAGQSGVIALALVVFATWKPGRILVGAYIFGGVSILQMNLQAWGVNFPGQFFNMAPYLATMIVLIIISSNRLRIKLSAPASLTIPFFKGR